MRPIDIARNDHHDVAPLHEIEAELATVGRRQRCHLRCQEFLDSEDPRSGYARLRIRWQHRTRPARQYVIFEKTLFGVAQLNPARSCSDIPRRWNHRHHVVEAVCNRNPVLSRTRLNIIGVA